MAAVVAVGIAWGIAIPGVRALARQWRRGRWQTMLIWLAWFGYLFYGLCFGFLFGFLQDSHTLLPGMPIFIITLCSFIFTVTVVVILLYMQWSLWKAPKYRRYMITILTMLIFLLLSGAFVLTILIFALNGVNLWPIAPISFSGGPS
jgi:hypothetical protein